MDKLWPTAIFCLCCAGAPGAIAQANLGDLLDKGATKVVRTEWLTLLPVTLSGVTMTGSAEFEMSVKTDGSFRGRSTSLQGHGSSPNWGWWRIDDSGRFCVDENFPKWNLQQTVCGYFYKLDGQYFRSDSDSDRNAPISPRKFVKG